MKETDCVECGILRENSASLYAEYVAGRDELVMTRKHDLTYVAKKQTLEQLKGRLRESYRKAKFHREQHPAD